MRRPTYHGSDRQRLEVSMTPMIDVVFLLLIFFVWTASFQITELVLPTEVATSGGTQQPSDLDREDPLQPVVVKILTHGSNIGWQVDGQPHDSLAAVGQKLRALASLEFAVPVILDVQGAVPLGDVIDVYDLCLIHGFQKVQFAAAVPPATE